jgi:hypothetical protein
MTRWLAFAHRAVVAALLTSALSLGPVVAHAQQPTQASLPCPVPLDQLGTRPSAAGSSIAVCVDRGPGAVYVEGEPIMLCVTVSVPTIMIFPPPPPPVVRVTNSTDGGPERTILREQFNGDFRCIDGAIEAPFGHDVFTAQVLDTNGNSMAQDVVQITTQPR